MPQPGHHFPVKLTKAQRKFIAEIVPEFAERLKLEEQNLRTVLLTLDELKTVKGKVETAARQADTRMKKDSLPCAVKALAKAIENSQSMLPCAVKALAQAIEGSQNIRAIPVAQHFYQFKITLKESQPPIWRRIQVKDCTLDKMHEHIQIAMGWTNSHLHHFKIGEQYYGDPELMQETFEEFGYKDSTTTNLSDIIPQNVKKFKFIYEYDFGDSWYHEILFEGCLTEEPGKKYPLCVRGKRACPPEDCGGIWGYPAFIQAIENLDHERHEELLAWIGGSFDPEAFDPAAATKAMKKGLRDWRREAW